MKRFALLLFAVALVAAVAIPASASAKPHHAKLRGCPKGKHHPRKPGGGRYRRCVKNRPRKAAPAVPGTPGAPGAPGTKVEVITPVPPPPPPTSETV